MDGERDGDWRDCAPHACAPLAKPVLPPRSCGRLARVQMRDSRAVLGVMLLGSIAIAIATVVTPAHASEEFPEAIREAAAMPCTPSCVICHGVDPGTSTTFTTRQLGRTLFSYGLPAHEAAKLKANYAEYQRTGAAIKDTTVDLAAAARVDASLKRALDPETGADVCIPTYGCGAHLANHAPPRDAWSAIWIVGALALGALVRRQISKPDSR